FAPLTADQAGELWGTTMDAGFGEQTLFRISPSTGEFTHVFDLGTEGRESNGELFADQNGNLWGTTQRIFNAVGSTVFKYVIATGTYTTVVRLDGVGGTPIGRDILGGVTLDANGVIFGTTTSNDTFTNRGGLIFRIDPGGSVSVLHIFGDQLGSYSSPIFDSDVNFYGVRGSDGTGGGGSVWKIRFGPTPTTMAATKVSDT